MGAASAFACVHKAVSTRAMVVQFMQVCTHHEVFEHQTEHFLKQPDPKDCTVAIARMQHVGC